MRNQERNRIQNALREIAGLLLPDLHLLNVACGVGEEVHVITIYWE
ncbi:MAG: hypothetical protein QME81_08235 [bacterium]|nr:hypothetical protein [bacterium]